MSMWVIMVAVWCFLGQAQVLAMTNVFVGVTTAVNFKRIRKLLTKDNRIVRKVRLATWFVVAVRYCRTQGKFYLARRFHERVKAMEQEARKVDHQVTSGFDRDLHKLVAEIVAEEHKLMPSSPQ